MYEDKSDPSVRGHRVRLMVQEIWNARLEKGGKVNAHLARMVSVRTELADLQYTVDELNMCKALLLSLIHI